MSSPAASVRATERSDIPALKAVIDTSDLFPSEMLDDMIAPFFNVAATDEEPRPEWLTLVDPASGPVGVAYAIHEKLTDRTWNLLLIAVHGDKRGRGLGSLLLGEVERVLKTQRDARILLVETSSTEAYSSTRRFYEKRGYARVAQIPEFYEDGDDKIVFHRRLGSL
ncbi:hypothetical protein P43SY_000995 [Pythium insidiosum]|uniref:N-acetyltransferase domain-containing protein n=1 Tax=Pythium insidiosum TaxID=114742 RepID=A0AAD5M1X7_PYTIN|nr:hypothetical protein P43SY_000995 [Pythium insidiosum]